MCTRRGGEGGGRWGEREGKRDKAFGKNKSNEEKAATIITYEDDEIEHKKRETCIKEYYTIM